MAIGSNPVFWERLRQVQATCPDRAAVLWRGEETLTYAELGRRTQALATGLCRMGVRRGQRIGLAYDRSWEHLVALLAAWSSGAAFVPLDPHQPKERLAFIVKDAELSLVLTSPAHAARLGRDLRVVTTSELFSCAAVGRTEPGASAAAEDEAYVIYTSGSTGRPKGVSIAHRGIAGFLEAQVEAFALSSQSRALTHAAHTFDASLSELCAPLLVGGCVVIEPQEALAATKLPALFSHRRITHANLPPALLACLDPEDAPDHLETVIIGGEAPPATAVRRWAQRVRLISVYGPTEATVCTSLVRCGPDWSRSLIGKPIAGTELSVQTETGSVAPVGQPGELWISGPGLAIGYVGSPELTEARFVIVDGKRWYKSGDRVVAHADGELEYLGRIDRQLKLRGLRIEPEEIERNLIDHPEVEGARVLVRTLGAVPHPALVAFARVRGEGARPDLEQDLRAHLAARLPAWMLPERIVLLSSWPLSPHGKLDHDALATLPIPTPSEPKCAAATSATEQLLCELWERILRRSPIGVHDDFFTLGGDSFATLELAALAAGAGLSFPPSLVVQHPTIARLLAALGDNIEASGDAARSATLEQDAALGPSLVEAIQRCAAAPPPKEIHDPRCVLLTGGTGFLGSRLLLELLRTSTAEIRCLVRDRDPIEALSRLQRAVLAHGGEAFADSHRISVVLGDLERPLLGLGEANWRALVRDVDLIHHAAAHVNLVLPYRALSAPNVSGTHEILRLLAESGRARLHAVSSLSVFVATDRNHGRCEEADTLEATRYVYGGYAQSKWVAERMLHRARGAGLTRLLITRPGLITPDSETGQPFATDFLRLFIRGLARLGSVPAGAPLALDVTPVDFAAKAMLALSETWPPPSPVYHLANPVPLRLDQLVHAMTAAGVSLAVLPPSEWRTLVMSTSRRDGTEAAALLAMCRALRPESLSQLRAMDLFQATGITFDSTRADRVLGPRGVRCPPPSQELIRSYVRGALEDL